MRPTAGIFRAPSNFNDLCQNLPRRLLFVLAKAHTKAHRWPLVSFGGLGASIAGVMNRRTSEAVRGSPRT